jgi:CRP/FNR family cyclic AMP-dependent transcriptional regulator
MTRSDARAVVAALQSQPVFAECGRRDLQDLAEHAERSSVPAQWPLIHQQTPADACYVILDGEASVTVGGEQVATISAGAVVGETGVAGHRLRNASVTSITPLDLLHIDATDFIGLIERRPALKAALLSRTKPAADATVDA